MNLKKRIKQNKQLEGWSPAGQIHNLLSISLRTPPRELTRGLRQVEKQNTPTQIRAFCYIENRRDFAIVKSRRDVSSW